VTLSVEEIEDRISAVFEAQEMIEVAAGMVDDAVRGTEFEQHTKAYVTEHLRNLAQKANRYDTDLDDVASSLRALLTGGAQ